MRSTAGRPRREFPWLPVIACSPGARVDARRSELQLSDRLDKDRLQVHVASGTALRFDVRENVRRLLLRDADGLGQRRGGVAVVERVERQIHLLVRERK